MRNKGGHEDGECYRIRAIESYLFFNFAVVFSSLFYCFHLVQQYK
jgi:hypothetical protein